MDMIILTVLGLIVLLVLVLILTGRMNIFSRQATDCTTKGGICIPTNEPCSIPGPGYTCREPHTTCCLSP